MDTKTKFGSKSILYFHDNTLTTIKSSDFSEINVFRFYLENPSQNFRRTYNLALFMFLIQNKFPIVLNKEFRI